MSRRRTRRLALALCAAAAVGALAAALAREPGGPDPTAASSAGANIAYPMDTLADWTAHADRVVVAAVVAEREGPGNRASERRGEGPVTRLVTLRIERTLWRRAGAAAPDRTLTMPGSPWMLKDGRRERWLIGPYWIEVGGRYVLLLDHNDDPSDADTPEWPLAGDLAVPLIGDGTPADIRSSVPALRAIAGKTPDEIAAALAAADAA